MRRSSRARPNPPSTAAQYSNSSSSAAASSRPERSTRSNNKTPPSRRGSAQRSQSIDDPADLGSRNEPPHTRNRQRGRDEEETNNLSPVEDEYNEEDEKTRCICGKAEYPGLPPPSQVLLTRNTRKGGVKEEHTQNAAAASDPLADEPGSLFIQCDRCQVWQHGGCVGIMDEASCPDEYFCEECRKDLHKIITHSHGQKCSHYVPVVGPDSPSSSSSSSRDNSRNTRDKKAKNDAAGSKRRSTMNSRDAAYDEEEQLRRAIEESKEESKSVLGDTGNRRPKRTRSDDEVSKQATKRQRTGTPASSASKPSNSQPVSDDETKTKVNGTGNKKTRATATRSQRDKDNNNNTEKEAEEEAVPEPASRRKGRSERRKEAESEPPEASPSKPVSNPPTGTQSAAQTPDTAAEASAPAPKQTTRKSGRPARRGRVGRNQYTRDREVNGNMDGNYTNGNSPRRGQSRDGANGDSPTNGGYTNGGESGRPSRPRYMNPNRTTMNDMRRRVAGILEFISRMQVEMAASGEQATPPNGENGGSSKQNIAVTTSLVQNLVGEQSINGDTPTPDTAAQNGETPKERDFKDLNSMEMMDVLTRGLLKWQQEYGKYGDK